MSIPDRIPTNRQAARREPALTSLAAPTCWARLNVPAEKLSLSAALDEEGPVDRYYQARPSLLSVRDTARMSRYTLNFAPIELAGNTEILVGRQSYSADRLHELRREFGGTHVFQRMSMDDAIVDIPVVAGTKPIGNLQELIDLRRTQGFWSALLSAALLRAFAGQRDLASSWPVTVLGSASRGLVQHPKLPSWIQKRTALEFDTRSIYLPAGKRLLGVVCETKVRNIIDRSCAELMKLGVPVTGRYVQIERESEDDRLLPRRKLVGRVTGVDGDTLVLEDHAPGFETVHASEAFLEARREIFDDCIQRILGRDAASVLNHAEASANAVHSGPQRKKAVEDALTYLRDRVALEAVPGVGIVLGKLLSSDQKEIFPATEVMPRPTLVFDPSGSRKDDWNERGIKKNGPYDQRTFSPKKLNIAVICQAKHEGQVDRFVAKFLDGMPNVTSGQNNVARYGDGFIRRFHLEKPSVTFFTTRSASAEDYAAASRGALALAADNGFKWHIALVQVEEEFETFDGSSNPYYATKSIFLKRDVAVQSVRLETMAQSDQQLVFSLNHMSLATYAKIGGTPWLLAAQQTVAHELVIGLGSHSVAALGDQDLRIVPPDLAVAAAARGLGPLQASDREPAWQLVTSLTENESGLARDATQLAVFDYEFSRIAQVDLASATRDDLIQVLQSVSRSMKRWTFEHVKRTVRSEITRWHVDNEYHVQNLLWAILAPMFSDLEDEENLPSIGQMHPRADLGVPSLRTLIEVKFLRHRGQSGFTKIIEEIAADTSLYLSRTAEYDNIIAFVWDDCAQTEQHHELKSGIERIRGISAAIILPRPSSMARTSASS